MMAASRLQPRNVLVGYRYRYRSAVEWIDTALGCG